MAGSCSKLALTGDKAYLITHAQKVIVFAIGIIYLKLLMTGSKTTLKYTQHF